MKYPVDYIRKTDASRSASGKSRADADTKPSAPRISAPVGRQLDTVQVGLYNLT